MTPPALTRAEPDGGFEKALVEFERTVVSHALEPEGGHPVRVMRDRLRAEIERLRTERLTMAQVAVGSALLTNEVVDLARRILAEPMIEREPDCPDCGVHHSPDCKGRLRLPA